MCECKICQRGRTFRAQLEQLPEAQRAYFESLYDDLEHIEADRNYYRVVVDGSWPTADEVIKRMRSDRAAGQTEASSAHTE